MEATYGPPPLARKDRKVLTAPLLDAAIATPEEWASVPLEDAALSERALIRIAAINRFVRHNLKVQTRISDDRLYVKIVPLPAPTPAVR
jgi:hypothetical protein